MLRSGAKVGDDIWVSGTLGDARLSLEVFRGKLTLPPELFELARLRMEMPTPRVALGLALRGMANAAIDVSDGLTGDLSHVLRASGVGATLDADVVMQLTAATQSSAAGSARLDAATLRACTLAGGDDYELVFTAPASLRDAVMRAAHDSQTVVTRIGRVESEAGLRLVDSQGLALGQDFASFDHFG